MKSEEVERRNALRLFEVLDYQVNFSKLPFYLKYYLLPDFISIYINFVLISPRLASLPSFP